MTPPWEFAETGFYALVAMLGLAVTAMIVIVTLSYRLKEKRKRENPVISKPELRSTPTRRSIRSASIKSLQFGSFFTSDSR
jgi:hypothetical protein